MSGCRTACAGSLVALALLVIASGTAPAADSLPPPTDANLVHLLGRTTYGVRAADLGRVRQQGIAAYLEAQLYPERLSDPETESLLAPLATLTLSTAELLRGYPRADAELLKKVRGGEVTRQQLAEQYPPEKRPTRIMAELAAARMVRAVTSERQLHEVMVDFWFNHFNVYAQKSQVRWYISSYEREAIRPYALGRFRDLVRATARHPAMLFYLDNWLSVRPDTVPRTSRDRARGLNENYARELMELHTLGVDGGYTQADVREVARAFTGWSIQRPQTEGGFVFRAAAHDRGEKIVLGQRLPPSGGEADGERVIELLVRHPATARFIATKLARRFVADDPPPALVERLAGVFRTTDGDIRAMLRALLTTPEFWAEEARAAKIKKPVEFVASTARALGARMETAGGFALAAAAGRIGERLLEAEPPTGYPDRAEHWVNPGALLARMNVALDLAHGRMDGVGVDLASRLAGSAPGEPADVLERLLGMLLHGRATARTRQVLVARLADSQITRLTIDDRGPAQTDVALLASLVLGSPEFQRR